jgi:hypothetical protein
MKNNEEDLKKNQTEFLKLKKKTKWTDKSKHQI